jgi:hypothetical protein
MTIENHTPSSENIHEIDRITKQINTELEKHQIGLFYEKASDGTVSYNMDNVKAYLTILQNKSRTELTAKNTAAWIMAVQISLVTM